MRRIDRGIGLLAELDEKAADNRFHFDPLGHPFFTQPDLLLLADEKGSGLVRQVFPLMVESRLPFVGRVAGRLFFALECGPSAFERRTAVPPTRGVPGRSFRGSGPNRP